ncbi:ketopantoate reductase PanE/ApbA C terminal-domain-containing protein [Gloeopeniophorella convolvens]|nr:ketopantoate reductase PanE/ApbA C terminal-domain-containing protein [Gloeopeniophorella convolvens]
MLFHVLGLGPIGSLVSHHLCKTLDVKHGVVLIHKNTLQLQKANRAGNTIKVERHGVVDTSSAFRRKSSTRRSRPGCALHIHRPIESLIVALKAYTVVDAIKSLVPRISPKSTIVLLHNGMGVYERLVEDVFRNPELRPQFIVASNDHGAWNKDYFHTVHAGVGSINFGIVPDPRGTNFEAMTGQEDLPEGERRLSLDCIMSPNEPGDSPYRPLRNTVAALSGLTGLDAVWKPISHVELAMKRKLVVNSTVNPLTAIIGCRNGELLESQEARKIIQRVCFEASQAFAMQAQHEAGSWDDKEKRAMMQAGFSRLHPSLTTRALEEECLRVIKVTANNNSSMSVDVRNGSYTEINFMNGYLVGLGRSFDLPMTTTTTLLNLVKLRTAIPLDRVAW